MVMLDNTVVNVALPTISRTLGMGISSLEWVVNGYTLSFAMLMLTGGKLADYFGRRRFFVTGLVLFSAASLVCGLSSSGGFLIVARVVQGAGAALLAPATLSIISATFPPEERDTAIGIWAGVSATALAIGPMVGGFVTEHMGWNWIFFINVPIGAVGVFAALIWVDESRDTALEQQLDLGGLALAATSVFALTYALIDANHYGWGSPRIVGLFAASGACLAAFVALELRERLPMLDLSRFRSGTFTGGNIVALLIGVALFGIVFYLSLYMQEILGYSAVRAGAAQLPFTALIVLVAPLAGKLTDRVGPRLPTVAGTLLLATSLLLFTEMGVSSHYLTILPGLIVGGIGTGLAMGPTTVAVLSAVRRRCRRRLRRRQHLPPDRRRARDRGDGRDRKRRDPRPPGRSPLSRSVRYRTSRRLAGGCRDPAYRRDRGAHAHRLAPGTRTATSTGAAPAHQAVRTPTRETPSA
jgi:EmrB/QacA subfamily drug resistance transporter